MKYLLERMMIENSVEFWYHAFVTDAILESKSGRESDGLSQPLTLMFEIDNIDSLGGIKAADMKIHEFYRALAGAIDRNQLPIRLPYGPQRAGAPYLIRVPARPPFRPRTSTRSTASTPGRCPRPSPRAGGKYTRSSCAR